MDTKVLDFAKREQIPSGLGNTEAISHSSKSPFGGKE